jgi:hypothetical protein
MAQGKYLICGKVTKLFFQELGRGEDKREYAMGSIEVLLTGECRPRLLPLLSFFPKALEYLKTLKEGEELRAIGVIEIVKGPRGTKQILSLISPHSHSHSHSHSLATQYPTTERLLTIKLLENAPEI